MRIRIIELLAQIKVNIVAFCSIAMFVCLGVGLFLGIQWGATAIRDAAHGMFESNNSHDIEVQFPYGITDSDLAKIKEVEGVTEVETGYTGFVSMEDGSTNHVLKMQSMTKNINKIKDVKGTLPMEKNEVALLSFWAEKQNINIGDTITLKHDSTDSNDKDGMQLLKSDKFEVTALVSYPLYAYRNSDGLGVSNIGAGNIDCVAFVTTDAFDETKYNNAHSNVYITCEGLRGISTFTDEYKNKVETITSKITELGKTLGTERYNKVYGEAKDKVDDAQKKINDGEKQLEDGKKTISDGEQQLTDAKKQLEDGESQLVGGLTSATAQQNAAQTQLDAAYRQLADGQAKYDAGLAAYNTANDTYNQLNAKFESVHAEYDAFVELYYLLREYEGTLLSDVAAFETAVNEWKNTDPEDTSAREAAWANVEAAYNTYLTDYNNITANYGTLSSYASTIGNVIGLPISIGDLPNPSSDLTEANVEEKLSEANAVSSTLSDILDAIANASITVNGVTITLLDIPGGLALIHDQLVSTKDALDDAKVQLDSGWAAYNSGKATYDAGVAQGIATISSTQQQIDQGRQTIEDKTQQLEDAKKTLDEKTKELEDGKAKLEDGKNQLAKLKEYEWVVMSRRDGGTAQAYNLVSSMMDSVKFAMASLFIIVGLFVCYSCISRLVHEHIIQIGTKKALGFRRGEIAQMYLVFATLAVALGALASIALAIFVVQGIMNPTAAKQFTMPAYGPYFEPISLLILFALELVLILASTWLAIRSLLKREALDLLRGETLASGKQRFYERWRIWNRMSLFSQTVVNNCVNDKRRVAGTIIGVVGCTALIVVACTLQGNVARSLERQYTNVYHFDTIAYLSEESEEAANNVAMALYKRGINSTPAFKRRLQMRQSDGMRNVVSMIVPTNEDAFKKFFSLNSTSGGEANISEGGIWVSSAYGEHSNAKVGDEITLTENTGKTHTFKIAGFFEYYLLRHEVVLSPNAYREAFGEKPSSNILLVNTDGADLDRTREALKEVKGYDTLAADRETASYAFNELTRVLSMTVLIYLSLSAAMAVMVLFNLDAMFVSEKKRELIVLMINGFSVKEAKAYIYRDSIVLTIIGIIIGIIVGTIMGSFTVAALEPVTGSFVKSINWVAAAIGAVGAGTFAIAVLLWSLRAIPRFELTDINRF